MPTGFWDSTIVNLIRTIQPTETDADSPDNETTYGQMRKWIEALTMLNFATGDEGSATSDPPDDATGILTDTGAAYQTDEHNGRTLLITSGSAIGNMYTIDDTTATTLVCTGDNLYSDSVRSGDTYLILYDLLTRTMGHNHDAINAPEVALPNARSFPVHYNPSGNTQSTAYVNSPIIYQRMPANLGILKWRGQIKTTAVGDTIYLRLLVADGTTYVYSSTASYAASTAFQWATVSAACTVLTNGGDGYIGIQIKMLYGAGAGNTGYHQYSHLWWEST